MSDENRDTSPLDIVRTMPRHWGYIFRHYTAPDRQRLAKSLSKVCHRRRIKFLIAGDWRLACKISADGIHMPEGLMRDRPASPFLLHYRSKIITTSAHAASGLRHAFRLSVNAVFLSPVYPTASHPNVKPLGTMTFSAHARSSLIPVYALGGLKRRDSVQLRAVGASGIAGISFAEENV
jgi:thiamine-phosphate pyrophosphorylase